MEAGEPSSLNDPCSLYHFVGRRFMPSVGSSQYFHFWLASV
ncbi:MAG: hypothetical protein ACFNYD_06880 [Bacteroides sp.]